MRLQAGLDLAHAIREAFPHVEPSIVENDKWPGHYVLGLWRLKPEGGFHYTFGSWIIQSRWDYENFLTLHRIFAV